MSGDERGSYRAACEVACLLDRFTRDEVLPLAAVAADVKLRELPKQEYP